MAILMQKTPPQARYEKKQAMNAQRTEDYKNGSYALAGGVVDPLPEDAPQFVKDYHSLLQDAARLPSSLSQFGRRLECHFSHCPL